MTRDAIRYGEPRAAEPGQRPAVGYDADTPCPGFYRLRLVSGGFPCGVKIWWGPPHDPVTGEVLDRGWRFQATLNGEPVEIDVVWPRAGREPTDKAEHDHLCAVAAWAKEHAPNSPQANPTRKVNRLSAPLLL